MDILFQLSLPVLENLTWLYCVTLQEPKNWFNTAAYLQSLLKWNSKGKISLSSVCNALITRAMSSAWEILYDLITIIIENVCASLNRKILSPKCLNSLS